MKATFGAAAIALVASLTGAPPANASPVNPMGPKPKCQAAENHLCPPKMDTKAKPPRGYKIPKKPRGY